MVLACVVNSSSSWGEWQFRLSILSLERGCESQLIYVLQCFPSACKSLHSLEGGLAFDSFYVIP